MSRGPAPPDKPADRPRVPEAADLIRAVYAREHGGAGCCLHLVTDDGNVQERFMGDMLADALLAGHPDCIAAAQALAAMTVSPRRRAIGRAFEPLRAR